jgi:uncharacterized protein (DUF2336 family)
LSDNPTGLDPQIFDDVLMRGGADARKELARQLSAFIADNDQPSDQRDAVTARLVKLATDPVSEVRHCVAQHLSSVTPLVAELIFTIIADEDEIALPFLAASPALDLPKMMAVLKVGDEARQMQIAARKDLFEACADHIIEQTDSAVCAALLENPAFEPSDGDYRALYRRFCNEPQIVDRLLARDDVPLDIRILQAKRASSRLQKHFDCTALAIEDPAHLIADAEESATLQVLAQAYEAELDAAISFLLKKDMLTPSLILRAAVAGEIRVVERALAQLSGVPLKRVRGLIYQHGSLKSVFGRCSLPPACMHLIQAAIEVEREIRRSHLQVSSDGFGTRVVETIMTGFASLSMDDKLNLLAHVENFGTERPRAMAEKLKLSLRRSGVIAA